MASKALLDLLFEERSLVDNMNVINNERMLSSDEYLDDELSCKFYVLEDELIHVRKQILLYLNQLNGKCLYKEV